MKPQVAAVVALKTSTTDQFFAVPTCTATQCFCFSALPVAEAACDSGKSPQAYQVSGGQHGDCRRQRCLSAPHFVPGHSDRAGGRRVTVTVSALGDSLTAHTRGWAKGPCAGRSAGRLYRD